MRLRAAAPAALAAGVLLLLAAASALRTAPADGPSLDAVAWTASADTTPSERGAGHGGASPSDTVSTEEPAWRMPPMETDMPMLPSLTRLEPGVAPFLPLRGVEAASLPAARPRQVVELSDGDSLTLRATPVRREIDGRTFRMWGYNGQHPGPLLRVPRGAEIVVEFVNEIEMPSTVHWHGVRVENRFDGVPGVTQEPVASGERFVYRVRFKDAGIYWYHPHLREDVQQDLGLYGNIRVEDADEGHYPPANREEVVTLDDLVVDDRGLFPWGEEAAVQTLMGRFGNIMLVNGGTDYAIDVAKGEVVRFFFTNVANTRTFNLRFDGAPMKLLGADIGRFEREQRVEQLVVAPAQRYVVDVRFSEAGTVALTNSIQAINHYRGEFYPSVDTLGLVHVSEEPAAEDHADAFRREREVGEVRREMEPYREHLGRAPDRELVLTMDGSGMPLVIRRMMQVDTLYSPPVEFNDAMPMMNYASSGERLTWILRDPETGAENMDIDWTFREGEVVKIRLRNSEDAPHPMQHPIHLHGQRFLVLARDGVPAGNLAWKDTALVPVGTTVDILVEFTNPGDWMLHCHIAEHLEAGMMTTVHVEPAGSADDMSNTTPDAEDVRDGGSVAGADGAGG